MIDRMEFGDPTYRIRHLGGKDDGSGGRQTGGNPRRFRAFMGEKDQEGDGDTKRRFRDREKTDRFVASMTQKEDARTRLDTRVRNEEREEGVRHVNILVA